MAPLIFRRVVINQLNVTHPVQKMKEKQLASQLTTITNGMITKYHKKVTSIQKSIS